MFIWPADPARIQEEIEYVTLITNIPGKEQRRAKVSTPRRRWRLRFRKDQVDGSAIWSFYIARRGAFEAFQWTNPIDEQTYTVRFEEDSMSQSALWKAVYESGLTIVEVI